MPSDELHAWEPHPEYEHTEIRRDGSEKMVLSLQPEGLEDSQCWAWTVHPAMSLPWRHGVNMGSDLDREVARAQADAAAVSYGYRIVAPDTWAETARRDAPAIARRILNLAVGEAARVAQEAGITFRIGRENGRPRQVTDDRRRDRVTATVVDGIVTEAEPR